MPEHPWVHESSMPQQVPQCFLLFFLSCMQLLTAVFWILPLMELCKLLEQLSETRLCTAAIQAIFSEDKITESARVVGSGQERSLFASVSSFCFDTCSHHNYLSKINDVYTSILNMCRINWVFFPYFISAIFCPKLHNPSYGLVRVTNKAVGSQAMYECLGGYVLVGDEYRTCQPNGEWSGYEPYCRCEH